MMYGAVLIHSRTKGSKNGQRRYQYEDGTGTKEGLERRRARYRAEHPHRAYAESLKEDELQKINTRDKALNTYVRNHPEPKTKLEAVGDTINTLQSNSGNIKNMAMNFVDAYDKKHQKVQDLSGMSNQELRAAIDRINLEANYRRLTAEESKGRQAVERAFAIGMGTLSIANIGVNMVSTIKKMLD